MTEDTLDGAGLPSRPSYTSLSPPGTPFAGPPVADPAPVHDGADSDRIPSWELAIGSHKVTFDLVVTCWFEAQPQFEQSATQRELAQSYLTSLMTEFDRAHKGVRDFYYCSNIQYAVAVTGDNLLHYVCDVSPATVAVQDVLRQAQNLADEAAQYLSQSTFEVGTVANRLFRVAADALSTVDSPQPVAPPKEVIDQLHKELVDASDYYALRVGRDAQGKYLAGLGAGTLVVAAAIVIVALAASGRAFVGLTTDGLLCGATGGALGAGLSVLTRITKGQMKIDHHSGTNQIVTFGAVRPFIGAVLGVAAYAFTGAGLLSLQSPKAGGTLWLALGFAAGFSERLAQDMLTSPSLLSLKKTPGGAS